MPAEYVNKLARMFQDIKVSQDLNTEFKERQRGSSMAGESCDTHMTFYHCVTLRNTDLFKTV